MKPCQNILVPTDFSPGAEPAVEQALALRQTFGGALTLLHVYQLPVAYDGMCYEGDFIPKLKTAIDEQMKTTQRTVEHRARELGADLEFVVSTLVLVGDPSRHIVDVASERNCDLIVIGTHGRTGFSSIFIGSVAERVVRTSTCPVWTVRRTDGRPLDDGSP